MIPVLAIGTPGTESEEPSMAAADESRQRASRMAAEESVLANIRTGLPPLTGDPATMLERAEFLDRPEVLMQDPLNYSIARVIEHIIDNNDTAAARNFSPSFLRKTPPITQHAAITEIMRFFPAVEHQHVAARLQILEEADLIEYDAVGEDPCIYSPRVWQLEEEDDLGFRLGDSLKSYLRDAEQPVRAEV